MWNGIKREEFFLPQWSAAEWFSFSVSLSFCHFCPKSLLQTLCDLFLSPSLIYFELLSTGIKSASLNFADGSLWTVNSCFSYHSPTQSVITLIITLTIIINTIAINYDHQRYFDHSVRLANQSAVVSTVFQTDSAYNYSQKNRTQNN